jgi:SAM-dependent methyltransferase
MDLTEFMHGDPDPLLACATCGLAIRDESRGASYATDSYDSDLVQHIYPRYLEAFREKRTKYGDYLPPHAEAIELGSHLGAFLEAAEERNWRPTGLDIGEFTCTFSRRHGLRVKRESIEDTRLRGGSADAVFVWNCFEQLEDPAAALRAAHTLLKRFGLLVIHIPNFSFYERMRQFPGILAYNNLLGFPYLIGYTPSVLNSLLSRHGFKPIAGFDSTLITMPFPDLSSQVRREMAVVNNPYRKAPARDPLLLAGPWMEVAYRRQDI